MLLNFRRADRHIHEILETASDAVWEQLAAAGFPIPLTEPSHRERIAKLRTAQNTKETDPIRSIFRWQIICPAKMASVSGIAKLIEAEQFAARNEHAAYAVKRAFENYPDHTRAALLHGIQAGLQVPHGTNEFLKDIPVVDDGPLAAAALDKATPDATARFAFTIIGPETVGRLMDELFIVYDEAQANGQQLDETTRKEYWRLMDAIAATRQISFIEALQNRTKSDQPHLWAGVVKLLSRHGKSESNMLSISWQYSRFPGRNN